MREFHMILESFVDAKRVALYFFVPADAEARGENSLEGKPVSNFRVLASHRDQLNHVGARTKPKSRPPFKSKIFSGNFSKRKAVVSYFALVSIRCYPNFPSGSSFCRSREQANPSIPIPGMNIT